jgi:hypothetical protein
MLSVLMLNVLMLSVLMLSALMLSVLMLSVFMLSVLLLSVLKLIMFYTECHVAIFFSLGAFTIKLCGSVIYRKWSYFVVS